MIKRKVCKVLYGLVSAWVTVSFLSVQVYAEGDMDESGKVGSYAEAELLKPDESFETTEAVDFAVSTKMTEESEAGSLSDITEVTSCSEGEVSEQASSVDELSANSNLKTEQPASSFGNIYIDLDNDGKTTDEDLSAFSGIVKGYKKQDHNAQEISGEISRILYGPLTGSGEMQAPEYSSYYLNNAGQSTYPKDQESFGACWAFGSVSALESAILKERRKLSGADITAPTTGEPVLEGLANDVDLSEKYLGWLAYDHSIKDGSQNEGLSTDLGYIDMLSAGGLFGIPDSCWTSWRGIVNESDEPYRAENASDSFSDFIFNETKDGQPEKWKISGRAYPVGDENAPARVNKVITLPAPAVIEYKDGKNIWTGYNSGVTDLIKKTLVETGAVAISYSADQSLKGESGNRNYFNHQTWSQYNDSVSAKVNHSATIVGWDDEYPAKNFKAEKNTVPPANGAWLVKNSWGSTDYYKQIYADTFTEYVDGQSSEDKKTLSWGIPGENGVGTGYFWLSYYDKSISSAMAFGTDIPDDGWDHDRIYQYNYFSDMASMPLVLRMYDTDTSVANIFTAGENEYLDAVSVRTTDHDTHVNVKVYLHDGDSPISDPEDGKLVSTLEADVELAGFNTLKLAEPVKLKAGSRFAVVENLVSNGGHEDSLVSYLNVETALTGKLQNDDNMGRVRSYIYSEAGQTFAKVLSGGLYKWMSPESLTNELGGGMFNFGNALIKAFTILSEEPEPGDESNESGEDIKEDNNEPGETGKEDNNEPRKTGKEDNSEPGEGSGVSSPLYKKAANLNETNAAQVRTASGTISQVKAAATGNEDFSVFWITVAGAAAGAIAVVIKKIKRSCP